MKYFYQFFLLIFLLITLCGCSTIFVKQDNGFGHPYEGLTYSAQNCECNIIYVYLCFPKIVILLPYTVIDFVGSIVADTLILPIDLFVENEKPRKQREACTHL